MSLTVKPLIWEHHPEVTYRRETWTARPCGARLYQIVAHPERLWLHSPFAHEGDELPFTDLADAQAAAFEEWSAFIRAAVEETP